MIYGNIVYKVVDVVKTIVREKIVKKERGPEL